ncbi:MAG: hypothetical protein QNJ46_08330 [Leptolyngbyaceae cyanobacterium MO_188.B28]|nr:hypothetical protein [Leptolyngbyaceae cyanobacterium MO_188.B28]
MVGQNLQREDPLYTCTVPIETLTGRLEEELVAFGASERAAREQAAILLADHYQCSADQIRQLMQQAAVVLVAPWCAPPTFD